MKNLFKIFVILSVFAFTIAFNPTPAQADGHEFDLTVQHNINGNSLGMGLDKELPVDVCVDGVKAFTFELGDRVKTSLAAGNYYIEVKLAGTESVVLDLQTGDIPAGADVMIKAQRDAKKSIRLKTSVK